jgi:hypothetical protein
MFSKTKSPITQSVSRKSIISVILFAFLFVVSGTKVTAQIKGQAPSKEELKYWKKKAKGYVKKPLTLKQELDNGQKQINDLKTQLAQLQAEYAATADASTGLQTMIDSLKWENVQIKADKQTIEKKLGKMEVALKGEKKAAEQGTKLGLVYRTQVGAFVTHEMQNPPSKAEDFLAEKMDGFNKYLVGNFRTQPEAEQFAGELKKLGIKDAWAVPYIDGVRVTFAEANSYVQKQASGTAQSVPQSPAPAPKDK